MYRIGFVDDLRAIDSDIFPMYEEKFLMKGLTLLSPAPRLTKEALVEWIQTNGISCLLVDYMLDSEYSFSGTDLVAYINSALPDLPCIILTAFPGQSTSEHMVVKAMIYDRDLFTNWEKFSVFADELQYAAQVFTNRLELRKGEYIELLKKRTVGVLNNAEEERFLDLYKLLKAYGEVDEIPLELLRPEAGRKMDAMLDRLNVLIEKTSKPEGEG